MAVLPWLVVFRVGIHASQLSNRAFDCSGTNAAQYPSGPVGGGGGGGW